MTAVVKPNRLLVHRTDIDFHEPFNLRDLVNKTREKDAWLQPVHRLDKPTSGIVLFAPPGDALNALKLEFVHRHTTKVYWAVVRGWTEDEGVVEKPLPTAHNPEPKEARTAYRTLARVSPSPRRPLRNGEVQPGGVPSRDGPFSPNPAPFPAPATPPRGRLPVRRQKAQPVRGRRNRDGHLLLHAGRLTVAHPDGTRTLELQSAVPEGWAAILDEWPWEGETSRVPRIDKVSIQD